MNRDDMIVAPRDPNCSLEVMGECTFDFPAEVLAHPALPFFLLSDPADATKVISKSWSRLISITLSALMSCTKHGFQVKEWGQWVESQILELPIDEDSKQIQCTQISYAVQDCSGRSASSAQFNRAVRNIYDAYQESLKTAASINLPFWTGQIQVVLPGLRQAVDELGRIVGCRGAWPDGPMKPNRRRWRR